MDKMSFLLVMSREQLIKELRGLPFPAQRQLLVAIKQIEDDLVIRMQPMPTVH